MKSANAIEIVTVLGIAWSMLLAGVRKRALSFRKPRPCVVCKRPMRDCRCH